MKNIVLSILADIWAGVKFWGSILIAIAAFTMLFGFSQAYPRFTLLLFGIPATVAFLWFTGVIVSKEKSV